MIGIDDGGAGIPPLILVHSLGGRAAFWREVAVALRRRHRVIALDLRGHGRSAPGSPANSTLDDFVDDVLAVADALGITTFALAGHSFGALVALATAARAPSRVERLVLVDAPGAMDQVPAAALEEFLESVLGTDGRAFVREAYEANLERASQATRDAVLESLGRTDVAALGGGYTALFASDPRALLSRYPGPLRLIVDAANDSPMSLHQQVPDLDVVPVEGTSHWVMLDRPSAVHEAIGEFLEGRT
jgi:pimeloyl-ACP methyl ester carboxylesterase